LTGCADGPYIAAIPRNTVCPNGAVFPPDAAAFWLHRDFIMAAPQGEWLDEMVKRLNAELEKQLRRVSQAQDAGDAQSRAADARTLSALERTLERLSKLETARAAVREKKIVKHDTDARAALERRLDKRLAALTKKGAAGRAKPG
jgi:hypothetical protein